MRRQGTTIQETQFTARKDHYVDKRNLIHLNVSETDIGSRCSRTEKQEIGSLREALDVGQIWTVPLAIRCSCYRRHAPAADLTLHGPALVKNA
jgi:hypothetical protein